MERHGVCGDALNIAQEHEEGRQATMIQSASLLFEPVLLVHLVLSLPTLPQTQVGTLLGRCAACERSCRSNDSSRRRYPSIDFSCPRDECGRVAVGLDTCPDADCKKGAGRLNGPYHLFLRLHREQVASQAWSPWRISSVPRDVRSGISHLRFGCCQPSISHVNTAEPRRWETLDRALRRRPKPEGREGEAPTKTSRPVLFAFRCFFPIFFLGREG